MFPMAAYQNIDDISDDFKLDRDQITLVKLLGAGNFGQVSKAIIGASQAEVAVKTLKGNFVLLLLVLLLLLTNFCFMNSLLTVFGPCGFRGI